MTKLIIWDKNICLKFLNITVQNIKDAIFANKKLKGVMVIPAKNNTTVKASIKNNKESPLNDNIFTKSFFIIPPYCSIRFLS